jgi:hypothetical protein
MPSTPREIGLSGFLYALADRPRALAIGVWFTVLPALLMVPGLAMMSGLVPREPDHARIRAQGAEAIGHVRRVETEYGVTINGMHPKRVRFSYPAGGGGLADGAMNTLSVNVVSKWNAGDPITVRYLGGEATIPDLQAVDFPVELFIAMPFAFTAAGILFLAYGVAGALRKRRVLQYGDVRRARLLAIVPVQPFGTLSGSFLKPRFETSYSFVADTGLEMYGSALAGDLGLLNEKGRGDEIEILAAPGRTKDTLVVDARVRELLGAGGQTLGKPGGPAP